MEIHIRPMEKRLDRIMALEDRPLSVARPPDKRIAGRCNSYTLALVSMLRANGVPARSRCGFGAYFNPPKFEDHWVCEYWDADRRRWVLADAQLDAVWCEKIRLSFDTMRRSARAVPDGGRRMAAISSRRGGPADVRNLLCGALRRMVHGGERDPRFRRT